MTPNQWADFLKYASPYSIMVLTWDNQIVELKCPFIVKLKYDLENFKRQELVEVEQVKLSTNLVTVFMVRGEAYYYYHFHIVIK